MVVPLKTAEGWERKTAVHVPEGACEPPAAVKKRVADYFTTARTKDWETRLKEYRRWLEDKARDEKELDAYDWIEWSAAYRRDPQLFDKILARHLDQAPGNSGGQVPSSEFEAWKLRSTIAMYRRARVGREFHGFLDLPPEIRDMIYRHALVKGRVIVPNAEPGILPGERRQVKFWLSDEGVPYERYRGDLFGQGLFEGEDVYLGPSDFDVDLDAAEETCKPLGLIQGVNRAVNQEASKIFWSLNQFVFPAGPWHRPRRFNGGRPEGALAHPTNAPQLARDLSYTFDMRDKVTSDRDAVLEAPAIREGVVDETLTPLQAMEQIHNLKTFDLEVLWAERIDCIKNMTLDRLQLSFEECYCSVGCCRKVAWVLDRFLHQGPLPGSDVTDPAHVYCMNRWVYRPPKIIEIIGWATDREKTVVREKLSLLPGSEEIEIRFIESQNAGGSFAEYVHMMQ